MGRLALTLGLVAAVLAVLPPPGMFAAMAAGILAMTTGIVGYRRRSAPGSSRLSAAAGIALSALALLISAARYAATLAALRELEGLF